MKAIFGENPVKIRWKSSDIYPKFPLIGLKLLWKLTIANGL
jgi:hypothetical protein